MEMTWRVISGEVSGENGKKGTGKKKHKWKVENRQGEFNNSIGNVEAKELIGMTHGHELRHGMRERGDAAWRGIKGGKMGQL